MGESRDLAALAGKLGAIADALDGTSLRKLTSRVALAAKNDQLAHLDTELPGRKFRNWRPKLGAGYEVISDSAAVLKPRPTGPWKVLTDGRKPGSKQSRKAGRLVAWGATEGRGTWMEGITVIRAETPGRVDEGVQDIIRKALA